MGSSGQETARRNKSPAAAMGSGAPALMIGGSSKASQPMAVLAGEVFDGRPQKRARPDAGCSTSLWAGVPSDVLGVVLGLLPCFADRASVRCVCRHWRSVGRAHVLHGLHPPLPLLVLPKLRFSCLCSGAPLTAARSVQMPEEVAADDVRCVGSYKGWLVGVTPNKRWGTHYRDFDGECFMVNVFSHDVVRLPHLSTIHPGFSACKSLPVTNGSGEVFFTTNDRYTMSLRKVVVSASPDSGSKCIVAASSYHTAAQTLALWQPGMMSWHVCNGLCIAGPKDLVFYQGKLYVLLRFMAHLFAFELKEDEHGVVVSSVEHCVTELFHNGPIQPGDVLSNIVVWRGNLLLIIRRYDTCCPRRTLRKVEVFALDFSTNPYGLTEIYDFDGDCIFVDSCGCKSFPAGLHDGVEGDLIYFVDQYNKYEGSYFSPSYDTFVYNMRDGTGRPFAVELSPDNFGAPKGKLAVPLWLLPFK